MERRGISSPASKVLGIVASLASTIPRDPRPPQELAVLYPKDNNYRLQIVNLAINNLLSSVSSRVIFFYGQASTNFWCTMLYRLYGDYPEPPLVITPLGSNTSLFCLNLFFLSVENLIPSYSLVFPLLSNRSTFHPSGPQSGCF